MAALMKDYVWNWYYMYISIHVYFNSLSEAKYNSIENGFVGGLERIWTLKCAACIPR